MSNLRYRPIVYAAGAIVAIWLLAGAGFRRALNSRITPDQVQDYEQSVAFPGLAGPDRAAALHRLATLVSALSLDERQQVWPDIVTRWYAAMTADERSQFLAATALPGFDQTPNPLDLLPPAQRQQAIDEALQRLRAERNQSLAATTTTASLPASQ